MPPFFLFIIFIALTAVLYLLRPGRTSFPKRFTARCVWVCDGDTVWIRSGFFGRRRKIRLIGMDAPESEQAFGKEAEKHLRGLALGKRLSVCAVCADRYGRWVCRLYAGNRDLSLEMIRSGLAWPYYAYFGNLSPDERRAYREAASQAKQNRMGLWADQSPEAPWNWRRRHRTVLWRLALWLLRSLRAFCAIFRH